MTLILPQLYMPSRSAGGGTPTFITSVSSTTGSISVPGTVDAGDLCILSCFANDNLAADPSLINSTAFTGIGDDNISVGPDGSTVQLEYKVFTSGDITDGTIDGQLNASPELMIAFFYDLAGLSVNTAGNITTSTNRGSISVSADYSGQSGPGFWICVAGGIGTTDPATAHSGFTADNSVLASGGSGANSYRMRMIDVYQGSGSGPTGNLTAADVGDMNVGIASYITLS